MRRIPPVLVLFFLAPAIGELLSGSAPPAEFFTVFGLFGLGALYGGGAILARELALRWGKRWPTILTLGLAYGIVEEGLMVKSFFDPNWMDLGLLGVYGRWAGVNWVWAVMLTLYHAVVSIAIPILLAELIYRERRDEPWIGRRGWIGFSAGLIFIVLLGFFGLTTYRPPLLPYLLAAAAVVALYRLARRQPVRWGEPQPEAVWRPIWLALLGFTAMLFFFLLGWVFPQIGLPPLLNILAFIGLAWGAWRLVRRASGEGAWDDAGRLALASGALGFFILIAPLSELDAARLDNPAGMTLVALAALAFLVWLRFRVRRKMSAEASAA